MLAWLNYLPTRQNELANQAFNGYEDIVQQVSDAWNIFGKISREWNQYAPEVGLSSHDHQFNVIGIIFHKSKLTQIIFNVVSTKVPVSTNHMLVANPSHNQKMILNSSYR